MIYISGNNIMVKNFFVGVFKQRWCLFSHFACENVKFQEVTATGYVQYSIKKMSGVSGDAGTNASKTLPTIKDRYERLSLKERRKAYKCGNDYVSLASIPTWKEYAIEKNLTASKHNAAFVNYSQNDDFNEKLSFFTGDITKLEIDSIVNAANPQLLGGGGVDGAIHRAAGPDLKVESGSLAPCGTGQVKVTYGYNLPAKYVIHTVGPIGENAKLLSECYKNSLNALVHRNLRSIAFPCISTGVYGYPNKRAARVVLQTLRDWLETGPNHELIDRIILCIFNEEDVDIYHRVTADYFPLK